MFAADLPNFRRVRTEGVEAGLQSTHPPWTGSAWPSMYTGTDPSYHGVYDFFVHDGYPDEATVVSRNDVQQPAIWNYLTADDRPSVVMNLPVTHPAESLEGVLVPGYLSPEDAASMPPEARSELSAALGEQYRIYSRAEMADDDGMRLDGYLDLIDLRKRATVELLTDYEWDLGITQVQKTDAVFHNFDDRSEFREIYKAADAFLGAVLDAVPASTNVVICSDHGIGHKDGYAIYVNEILRNRGFASTTATGGRVGLGESKQRLVGDDPADDDDSEGGLREKTMLAAGSALRRLGIELANVYSTADGIGMRPVLEAVTPDSVKRSMAEYVDWSGSRAYCRSNAELGVRLNLEGREPNGVVSPGDYENVREEVIRVLRNVRTPAGEPAFDVVSPREELYDGPYTEHACDIVFVPAEMNHVIQTKLYGREFVPIDRHDHEWTGVFLATGPDIEPSATVSELSLVDVAPLVLSLLEQPVPERMTGTVPAELVDSPVERAVYDDLSFGTDATDRDDSAVTDRLEDLGYL
jgi:predicted AlkP superfamily phosphohydrolase/phosphomutase